MNTTPAKDVPVEGEEQQFLNYLRFTVQIVQTILSRLPPHVEKDDLLSVGQLGLLKAIRTFDPSKGSTFGAYARHRIRGVVLDELRKMDIFPRSVRERARMVAEVEDCLVNRLGREPTEMEMASEMGLGLAAYRKLRSEIQPVDFLCLDDLPSWLKNNHYDHGRHDCYDAIADQSLPLGEELERRDMLAVVYHSIKSLPPRQQQVLALYYVEGWTFREIGEALGFTESYACMVHKEAIVTLREHFQKEDRRCTLAG